MGTSYLKPQGLLALKCKIGHVALANPSLLLLFAISSTEVVADTIAHQVV